MDTVLDPGFHVSDLTGASNLLSVTDLLVFLHKLLSHHDEHPLRQS